MDGYTDSYFDTLGYFELLSVCKKINGELISKTKQIQFSRTAKIDKLNKQIANDKWIIDRLRTEKKQSLSTIKTLRGYLNREKEEKASLSKDISKILIQNKQMTVLLNEKQTIIESLQDDLCALDAELVMQTNVNKNKKISNDNNKAIETEEKEHENNKAVEIEEKEQENIQKAQNETEKTDKENINYNNYEDLDFFVAEKK